jgi:hypothetical protein
MMGVGRRAAVDADAPSRTPGWRRVHHSPMFGFSVVLFRAATMTDALVRLKAICRIVADDQIALSRSE